MVGIDENSFFPSARGSPSLRPCETDLSMNRQNRSFSRMRGGISPQDVAHMSRWLQCIRLARRVLFMNGCPECMKNAANRIPRSPQAMPGVEGCVFDGADQSQMAFWTCTQTATSAEHGHEFDEYMLVVQGCYRLLIDGRRVRRRTKTGAKGRQQLGRRQATLRATRKERRIYPLFPPLSSAMHQHC